MRTIIINLNLLLVMSLAWSCTHAQKKNVMTKTSIHQFSIEGLSDAAINFADFKGKKILVVNVASECGFTPQYADLQELQQKYSDKLVVVGMPCNDFGGQEPGSNTEIQQFCQKNYGVTFPITSKVVIKGDKKHPIYAWLTDESKNGVKDTSVNWNFHKFLLDENGYLIDDFGSMKNPMSESITKYLK
jgi:glutathione peroxidase